jgi:hypothetical protein
LIADWFDEIEPSTAAAQLKPGNLVLTVRRANGKQNAKAARTVIHFDREIKTFLDSAPPELTIHFTR